MMRRKTIVHGLGMLLAALPLYAGAEWQVVASEPGKRVEIDRDSIVTNEHGEAMARGRIVLDKPIIDPRTSASYRIIEITNRFDCRERTHATLKRSYFKDDGELLRQEEAKAPYEMPVRSGTPDDRLFREACRPKGTANSTPASQTIEKVNAAAAGLRQTNEAMIEQAVQKDVRRIAAKASAALSEKKPGKPVGSGKAAKSASDAAAAWAYEGAGAPERWGGLRSEYALCASGRRQAPIDIRDGIGVDLEPLRFAYAPSSFRVTDTAKHLVVSSHGGGFSLLGKRYVLTQLVFHRPAETMIDGKSYDMDVQLMHRAEDGQVAIVSILLERSVENPVIQAVLNHLPLERGGDVAPPAQGLDLERLLPVDRRYYAFMGSLTTPPCTENVLWLVMKEPQPVSAEQMAIFERLYPPNARPVQPVLGRIIKSSR